MTNDPPTETLDASLASVPLGAYSALEHISRSVHTLSDDVPTVLEAILVEARCLLEGASAVSLNLVVDGVFVPRGSVGAQPPDLDAVQQAVGAGPCIEASITQTIVHVMDMRREDRWPEYVDAALDLGVRSMVCVPLWVQKDHVGSLTVYATDGHRFTEHQTQVAQLFATHAAIAIAEAQRVANLQAALRTRDVIGQAKGILMERLGLTEEGAFDALRTLSQQTNRKLIDVAETVVGGLRPPESEAAAG